MKYLLMIYDNADSRELFAGEQGAPLMAEMDALFAELQESGELISTDALADPSNTKVVRAPDVTAPVVTDGPLAEAKEHFGGYLVIDVASEARAVEVAARFPSTRFTPMEVRPILGDAGEEM
ncbi:hypothetical protein EV383_0775 [Pseudonocardia sediminis]|uniref:YCII-related domain-containing protein n=1 Tax=Pseudonocardia sediminis TaxID=1397368 RepID=A0A4Q7UQ91_PSEST|nr:YciI family protein [Pseudonocardia sediminis]RZT83947.1 hypothetical protein EV383_0775 [Pseudonocardia sediminis]